jgi:ketosteroid isomerase-like protein
MSEESRATDLTEPVRSAFEAMNRRDFEAMESFYAPEAVLTLSGMGTSFEGAAAIRSFCEDFIATFDEYEIELEEIIDLGNGVSYGVYLQRGRPVGSSGRVQMRVATVYVRKEAMVARHMMYTDLEEGRAAAERLAEERG